MSAPTGTQYDLTSLLESCGIYFFSDESEYDADDINELLRDNEYGEIVRELLQEGLSYDEILCALDELECCKDRINDMIRDDETTEEEVQALLQQGLTYGEIVEALERRNI